MELATFGAILKYALELESAVRDFYKSLSEQIGESPLGKKFDELAVRGEKRLKTLERVRRENVTEMILEPIEGFDSEEFTIDTDVAKNSDEETMKDAASKIERVLYSFYSQAALKIEFLSEASYAFELLAEKNEETMENLSN